MPEKRDEIRDLNSIPVGSLGLIPWESCRELGNKVNDYLVKWRQERENQHKDTLHFDGYERDSYILKSRTPRFGTGEAKGVIDESIRGYDLYFLVDVCNY
ncbi:MAG: ribose-phosphate pyrophosphokinase-like domain-containing protein, partial [Lachnospiraceae bacterium]|nr:ribose-phosphate pyrophosphokinase-like domain-containing protein [Lachnospiraceae bacterium]